MKKILLFLILVISVNTIFADPTPKQKKIKFTSDAYYEGMAVDKSPQGAGVLRPCSRCTVTGQFNNNRISKGRITFSDHDFTITGEFSFAVMGQDQFWVIVNDGVIGRNRTKLPSNTPIKFTGNNYSFESHYPTYPKLPKSYIGLLEQFAGETKFEKLSDGRAKSIYNNENRTRVQLQKATYLKLDFANGAVAYYTVADRKSQWVRINGDFIDFTLSSDGGYSVSKYKITAGKTIITDKNIIYTFDNGNKYVGTVKDSYLNSFISSKNLEKLASFIGVSWKWDEFEAKALDGILTYPDGRSENVVNGLSDSRVAQIAAEKEAARKAAEEAARIAAEEEAKRKAAEEAARIAAEEEAQRKAAEEAARIAAEQEAQRKAAEEAARKAAEEEAKRKAAEEAARKAAEEEAKRKAAEEAARIAAEKEAQRKAAEEAARKAAEEEAKRKAAEEAARIAAEEEAQRKAAEEAARIAAEKEAQRKAAEEAARKAAEEEAKRKAAEEAARKAAEMEARRKAVEAAARQAAEEEAMRKAEKEQHLNKLQNEMDRLVAQQASIAAEKEAKRVADEARVAAEIARASVAKVKDQIVSAFEFMVRKKSHTGISQDVQVPRFFYHPTENPYSPNFRSDFDSRLKSFCPCVGYEIVNVTGDKVVCNLKKMATDSSIWIYQLEIGHNGGVLNIVSFDIKKARRIQ